MSDWQVALAFSEDGSNKFWRARVDGTTLYVNYGRIGTQGQTQVKNFPSADAAKKEIDKLEREKRKKGYEDESAVSAEAEEEAEEEEDEDEDEEEAPKAKKGAKGKTPPPPPAAKGPPAAPPAPGGAVSVTAAGPRAALFVLEGERKVQLTLSLDGTSITTKVEEKYADPGSAQEAFERLVASLPAEGYRRA